MSVNWYLDGLKAISSVLRGKFCLKCSINRTNQLQFFCLFLFACLCEQILDFNFYLVWFFKSVLDINLSILC